MASELAAAAAQKQYTSAIKLLTAEIDALRGKTSAAKIVADLLYNKGYCRQQMKLWRKALEDYEECLKFNPSHVKALWRKGQVLYALKKSEDALKAWRAASDMSDTDTDIELLVNIKKCLDAGEPFESAEEEPVPPAGSIKANGVAAAPTAKSPTTSPTTPPATAPPKAALAAPPAAKAAPSGTPAPASSRTTTTRAGPPAAAPPPEESIDCVKAQASASLGPAGKRSNISLDPSSNAKYFNPHDHVNLMVNLAITQINQGKLKDALRGLQNVLDQQPDNFSALLARGTAYALEKRLPEAVADFTKAIEIQPNFPDTYKRRGVAQSYQGDMQGAEQDLQRYIDLATSQPNIPGYEASQAEASLAEAHMELGMILQKSRNWRRAVDVLRKGVRMVPGSAAHWNMLGLCLTSVGDIDEAVAAYRQALKIDPSLKEAWVHMATALKEASRVDEAEQAFKKVLALDGSGRPSILALKVMAQMRQGKGEHSAAVRHLNKGLNSDLSDQPHNSVELYYYRAICYHAVGHFRKAVADYDNCMMVPTRELTPDTMTFQCRAFYQKEIALWQYHHLDTDVTSFSLDTELLDSFKENWCKKCSPPQELLAVYRMQKEIPEKAPLPPPLPNLDHLRSITAVADQLGSLLQNHHQGFLPNVRQQRAAGYAALELSQAVKQLVAAKKLGNTVWVNSEGATSQGGCAGRHMFGWRDAMDIVVKWRQLSEPNDEVVWVDLLTQKEFRNGFGSHTPMFSGQTKCVRYYMNFPKAIDLFRALLLDTGCAYDAQNRRVAVDSPSQVAALKKAKTAEDMYKIINEDCWVVVPIDSVTRDGHKMEGTRLTLVRVPNQPDGYEFSIRTPVTPDRWKDFEKELEALWELVVAALTADDQKAAAERVMQYAYYWYNFMPLARGTAAVGYTTLLSLFWATGTPITATIPKDYQVDWQAILAQEPKTFIANVSGWLYPPTLKGSKAPGDYPGAFTDPLGYPLVKELLPSFRNRIEALNGADSPRLP